MKSLNQIQLKILTLVGLICFLIPFTIYGLWIYVFDLGTNQTERVSLFKDYFPDFLNGRWDTTFLGIFFCVLAIIFSSIGLKLLRKYWRILNVFILILSCLLLLLNLFSMM